MNYTRANLAHCKKFSKNANGNAKNRIIYAGSGFDSKNAVILLCPPMDFCTRSFVALQKVEEVRMFFLCPKEQELPNRNCGQSPKNIREGWFGTAKSHKEKYSIGN